MAHTRSLKRLSGLTPLETRFVELSLEFPDLPAWQICKDAGYGGTKRRLQISAAALSKKAHIIAALDNARREIMQGGKHFVPTKDSVVRVMADLLEDKHVPPASRIAAGRLILETIPGAFVPLTVDHTGKVTLESWVEAMGGRPVDAPPQPKELEAEILDRKETVQ